MALINCPECGKQVSNKADFCPYCGCPAREFPKLESQESFINTDENENGRYFSIIKNIVKDDPNLMYKKVVVIKELRERAGIGLKESKDAVEEYFSKISVDSNKQVKKEFHGIYRYGFLGEKTEIYCPRCGSENCSYYQEQTFVPGKTKTRYTMNLNPLKPFTLVNKKEKVIKKDQIVTEQKIVCNSCGHIFY